MKIAIVGSRNLTIHNLDDYLPEGVTEIVSGGAKGIDACAREYAEAHGLTLTEFKPDYRRYRGGAAFIRNKEIVDYSDLVIAFWDGKSHGTSQAIKYCLSVSKELCIYVWRDQSFAPLPAEKLILTKFQRALLEMYQISYAEKKAKE